MDDKPPEDPVAKARREGRTVCPVCGHDFGDAEAANACPDRDGGGCGKVSTPDELIGPDDDYEWCL